MEEKTRYIPESEVLFLSRVKSCPNNTYPNMYATKNGKLKILLTG